MNLESKIIGSTVAGIALIKMVGYLYKKDTIFSGPNDSSGKLKYISGPTNVTHYKIADKEIYLFGENHIPVNLCEPTQANTVEIPTIFDLIIKANPQVTIDFFVEKQDKRNPIFNYMSDAGDGILPLPLTLTRSFFSACSLNRNLCKRYWPNLRLHGIDVRSTNNILLMSFSQFFQVGPVGNMKIPGGIGLLEKLYGKFLDKKYMFKNYKIDNQIDGVVDIVIKNKIMTYANEELDKKIEKYNKNKIAINMFELIAFYVDIYTLGRIFRTFGEYNSKYIIIYVGDEHRICLHNFLKTLDNKFTSYGDTEKLLKFINDIRSGVVSRPTIELIKNNIIQCVDIQKSNIPLFETAPIMTGNFANMYNNALKSNKKTLLDLAYYSYFKLSHSKLFGMTRRKSHRRKSQRIPKIA